VPDAQAIAGEHPFGVHDPVVAVGAETGQEQAVLAALVAGRRRRIRLRRRPVSEAQRIDGPERLQPGAGVDREEREGEEESAEPESARGRARWRGRTGLSISRWPRGDRTLTRTCPAARTAFRLYRSLLVSAVTGSP